jgi:hypothetical protein
VGYLLQADVLLTLILFLYGFKPGPVAHLDFHPVLPEALSPSVKKQTFAVRPAVLFPSAWRRA